MPHRVEEEEREKTKVPRERWTPVVKQPKTQRAKPEFREMTPPALRSPRGHGLRSGERQESCSVAGE
ncbi:hypothetical protein NDU88_007381 [Pleurodeles waltl]|uniref:Uncharacterized protein n=1 Tax=Pleurodeles waltl TaxID=8319 RepID=A0AAV7P203_PLEWA|nr:hypothetical protein NDU88_007381 [Pleurodeles waltl]